MNSQDFFMYILKTIIISAIFWGYYWIALRNKKIHYYNRFYLLLSLMFSLILPMLHINLISVDKPILFGKEGIVNNIFYTNNRPVVKNLNGYDFGIILQIIIAAGLLIAMIINIKRLLNLKQRCSVTKMGKIYFINTDDENAPFSFLNNLFWKQSISLETDEGKKIFKHELTHILQKHSFDRLFCQVLCSIFWVNPFYWIIQKELVTIHEFIADETAIGNSDTQSFAKMLLKAHYGNHFIQPTQSLFYSSIKRRLIMLTTSNSIQYSYLRRLIALPLLLLTIVLFSFRLKEKVENIPSSIKKFIISKDNITVKPAKIIEYKKLNTQPENTIQKILIDARKEKIDTAIVPLQETPKFPGGTEGWQQFLRKTINYGKIVEKGGGPGKYAVDLSFIIDIDGDVRDVKALNDPGYGSKEDAMRVLLSSPKWTPAMVNGKKVVYQNKITITYMVSE